MKHSNEWPSILPGSTVGIGSIAKSLQDIDLDLATSCMQAAGYTVTYGSNKDMRFHQFAGTDMQRATALQEMMLDSNIAAILLARGGYGSMRALELIPHSVWENRKLIIGYSDATVLHAWLNTILNIPTLHATMPLDFPTNSPEALDSLKQAMLGEFPIYRIAAHPLNKTGEVNGKVTGGNLSILYSMMATSFDWDASGWILFLEEVDEYAYHVDRMLTSLRLAGRLQHIKGLVIGGFTKLHDNQIPFGETIPEMIIRHTDKLNIPVCFDFPAGHMKDNRAIPFGIDATLSVDTNSASLSFA